MCLVQVKIFQKVIDLASKLFLLLNSQIFLFKIDIMIYEECKKTHFEYLPALGALCVGGKAANRLFIQDARFWCILERTFNNFLSIPNSSLWLN